MARREVQVGGTQVNRIQIGRVQTGRIQVSGIERVRGSHAGIPWKTTEQGGWRPMATIANPGRLQGTAGKYARSWIYCNGWACPLRRLQSQRTAARNAQEARRQVVGARAFR